MVVAPLEAFFAVGWLSGELEIGIDALVL